MNFLKNHTTSEKIQICISFLIQIFLLLAIILSLFTGDLFVSFISLLALVVTLIPKFLEKNYNLHIPIDIQFIITLFIFASLFLGEIKNYYDRFWWWDLMLHGVAGIVLGLIGFGMLYVLFYGNKIKAKPGLIVFFAFCFAVTLGTIWEIFEFGMDQIFGYNMQKPMLLDDSGLFDTMFDLIFDVVGALIASIWGYFYLKREKTGYIRTLVEKFVEKNPHLFREEKK